jgi:DnaJ family protein A protein 2
MVKSTKYYDTLNSKVDATGAQIKKSYLKLSREYHPDKNKSEGSEEKFKNIAKAYQVLSDPDKRKKYDVMGENFEENAGMPQSPFDLFNQFGFDMGGGMFGNHQVKPKPITVSVVLTLEEAYKGVQKNISFKKRVLCNVCDGSGLDVGKSYDNCGKCKGSGKHVKVVRNGGLIQQHITSCDKCDGMGKSIGVGNKCKDCKGKKITIEVENKTIDLPRGIKDGIMIKMEFAGNAEPDADMPGDLHIGVTIEKHPFFTTNGFELECNVVVKLYDALNEYKIVIDHPDGNKYLIHGKGCDKVLKYGDYVMSGYGFPVINSDNFGDLIVKVKIEFPDEINLSGPDKTYLKSIFKYKESEEKQGDCVDIPFVVLNLREDAKCEEEEVDHSRRNDEGNSGCVHQ